MVLLEHSLKEIEAKIQSKAQSSAALLVDLQATGFMAHLKKGTLVFAEKR